MQSIKKYISRLAIARGVLLVLFGIFVVAWPFATLATILMLAAIYLLVTGVVSVVNGVVTIDEGWSAFGEIIIGILAFLLGMIILRHPGAVILSYIYLLGVWFIIKGFADLFYRTVGNSRGMAMLVGILSIILGFLLLNKPVVTGEAFYWAIGLYALIVGPIWIAIGIATRSESEK